MSQRASGVRSSVCTTSAIGRATSTTSQTTCFPNTAEHGKCGALMCKQVFHNLRCIWLLLVLSKTTSFGHRQIYPARSSSPKRGMVPLAGQRSSSPREPLRGTPLKLRDVHFRSEFKQVAGDRTPFVDVVTTFAARARSFAELRSLRTPYSTSTTCLNRIAHHRFGTTCQKRPKLELSKLSSIRTFDLTFSMPPPISTTSLRSRRPWRRVSIPTS
mmetsp:Transcript_17942/g.71910  ORF Transcript_17942/g.71910 Transcript_17942/m.71910 type:complete len:215 (-) Transcript_17942:122-766(-)